MPATTDHVLHNYDINDAYIFNYAHVIEVTLQQWEYKKTFTVEIGGNCAGYENFDSAIDFVAEQIMGGNDVADIDLINDKGETLCVEVSHDGDIKDMVVTIRIIDLKEGKNDNG